MKTQDTKLKTHFFSLVMLFFLFSCVENEIQKPIENIEKSTSERLVFNSLLEFHSLISKVNSQNLNSGLPELEEKISKFPLFNSLSQSLNGKPQNLAVNFRILDTEILKDSISELVPDMTLRHFLNEKLEIEIENTIYKVTPFGTFYSASEDYEKLLRVLDKYYQSNATNTRIQNETLLEEGVYFEDTFGDQSYLPTYDTPVTGNVIYQANDFAVLAPYTYALPKDDYQKFKTYSYGAKTVVGQLIEGAFGGNSDFEENYNSTYRLRVKLYDFNYGFYKSLGMNAKLQKKGWTGIWALNDNVKAEKLILGWDGLLLNLKIPYAMPIGYPSFPTKGVSQEILNFTNFSLPTGNVTDVRIPFLGVQSISYDDLEKMLKKILKKTYSEITKEIWKEAEKSLATASYEIKQENVKSYRKVFPDEIKLALTRHEISANNANELSFVIDRSYGLTFKTTNGSFDSFSKNVLEPTLSSTKKMYDIDAASVYGASVFQYQLKGIRIIKELNE